LQRQPEVVLVGRRTDSSCTWRSTFPLLSSWRVVFVCASPLNEDLFALHLFLQLCLAVPFHGVLANARNALLKSSQQRMRNSLLSQRILFSAQASNSFPLKAANPPLSICFVPSAIVLLHHAQVGEFVPKLRTNHCGSQQWLHFRVARALLEVSLVWRSWNAFLRQWEHWNTAISSQRVFPQCECRALYASGGPAVFSVCFVLKLTSI